MAGVVSLALKHISNEYVIASLCERDVAGVDVLAVTVGVSDGVGCTGPDGTVGLLLNVEVDFDSLLVEGVGTDLNGSIFKFCPLRRRLGRPCSSGFACGACRPCHPCLCLFLCLCPSLCLCLSLSPCHRGASGGRACLCVCTRADLREQALDFVGVVSDGPLQDECIWRWDV